jgi:hypothetical protein
MSKVGVAGCVCTSQRRCLGAISRLRARLFPAYIELHADAAEEYIASRPDLIFREVEGSNPNHRYFAVRLRSILDRCDRKQHGPP